MPMSGTWPSTSHEARGTLHVARGTWHVALCTLHVAEHVARRTTHLALCTLHMARCTWHVARGTSHVARGRARRTRHVAPCTLHVARGTWHVACGTWHVARCTWHFARCTWPCDVARLGSARSPDRHLRSRPPALWARVGSSGTGCGGTLGDLCRSLAGSAARIRCSRGQFDRVLPPDAHRNAAGASGDRPRPHAQSAGNSLRLRAVCAPERRHPQGARGN
jgi:hypothetical protein